MAQLVAHLLCKQGVVGSNPIRSTHTDVASRRSRVIVRRRHVAHNYLKKGIIYAFHRGGTPVRHIPCGMR